MEERILSRIKPYNKTISKIKIQNIKYKKGNKYSNKITYNFTNDNQLYIRITIIQFTRSSHGKFTERRSK